MQQRSIPMYIILSIVTCGLFGLYWFIVLTDETNEVTGQTQLASGPMALILTIITCNIYGWYWAYKMGEKVDMIKAQNGQSAIPVSCLLSCRHLVLASSTMHLRRMP